MDSDADESSAKAAIPGKYPRIRVPTRKEAEDAVRTLIAWAGDDPRREGLLDTPQRVVSAYREFFSGYGQSPSAYLSKTFSMAAGQNGIVLLRNINISSHCEHHMLPFTGKTHIAYYPAGRIVGLSKLVRALEIIARRLQTQESMTAEVAHAIQTSLKPHGVAVMVEATHQCMSLRGVRRESMATITTEFLGRFEDPGEQERFLSLTRI